MVVEEKKEVVLTNSTVQPPKASHDSVAFWLTFFVLHLSPFATETTSNFQSLLTSRLFLYIMRSKTIFSYSLVSFIFLDDGQIMVLTSVEQNLIVWMLTCKLKIMCRETRLSFHSSDLLVNSELEPNFASALYTQITRVS